jgi:hypothetical protein
MVMVEHDERADKLDPPRVDLPLHDETAPTLCCPVHAVPGEKIDIGVERAHHRSKCQTERRADLTMATDDGHGLGGDPGRGAEHAEAGDEIGDLLELAAAELEVPKPAAMQPPHHRVGKISRSTSPARSEWLPP